MAINEAGIAEPDATADYLDTIALLQEEIARLEGELRLREEADATPPDVYTIGAACDPGEARAAELTSELAERDRIIVALWDQVALLEEAAEAHRSEWEQLHHWVEALERRVESGETDNGPNPGADQSRREAEAQREQLEIERRTWESSRRLLEAEVAGLRARLDDQFHPDSDRGEAMEEENRRLRHECQRLTASAATAGAAVAASDTLREQLRALRAELDATRHELSVAADENRRQQMEHGAELASARAESAREKLVADNDGLSLNERMRALREHFHELHQREEQERQEKRLAARLSRLWGRTGPRP